MKKLKLRRFGLHLPLFVRTRWFIAVAIGIAVLAGLGAYGWWSKTSWDTYEKQYVAMNQEVDRKLEAAFSLQSDTPGERQEKLARLVGLQGELERVDDAFCRPAPLVGWQRAIKAYAEREAACKETQAALISFRSSLNTGIEYLQGEQLLAKQLATAPTQAEVTETEFEGQLAAWRSVAERVKSASASGRLEIVKQVAVDATGGIVTAWEEVMAGHAAKDKARYTKATQALAAAYDALGKIAAADTEQLIQVAADLKEAYQKLK